MIRCWDLSTGQPSGKLLNVEQHVNVLRGAQLDGRVVAVSADSKRTVRAFDVLTGAPVFEPLLEGSKA